MRDNLLTAAIGLEDSASYFKLDLGSSHECGLKDGDCRWLGPSFVF